METVTLTDLKRNINYRKIIGWLLYALPVLFTVALFLIICAVDGLYPIGSKSISWCDMNQQAIPILAEYKDVLSGKADLFISYSNAGGMNFFVLFLYYCSSPFNLLIVFVDKKDISLFMNVLVMLKMAAAALTAFIYLHKKCGGKFRILNLALSVSYAFSGYVMVYYQLVSFLDCVYLLPLFVLGLDYIDEGKSPLLYAITLFLAMFFNYYVAYMMVVYGILRFGVGCLLGYKDKKRALNFLIGSLIAALLSAIVYIPVFIQYTHSARSGSVLEGLKNSSITTAFHTAVLAFFTLAIILPLLFSVTDKKSERLNRIMFLLMLFPLFIEPINKMWHTGTYMSFPSRHAFLAVFSAIAFVGEHYGNHEFTSDKKRPFYLKIIFSVLLAGLVLFVYLFTNGFLGENYHVLSLYSSTLWSSDEGLNAFLKFYAVIVVVSLAAMLLYRFKLLNKAILGVFILALVVNDAFFSANIYMNNPSHEVANFQSIMEVGTIIEDDGFYRVKEDYKMFAGGDGIGINAIGAMGYNSIAHYTSLTDKDYMSAIKKLGYSSYWMEVADNGGTSFTDAFLLNAYTLKNHDLDSADFSTDKFGAFKNQTLPFGIVTSQNLPAVFTGERSEAIEELYNVITGKNGLIERYSLDSATLIGAVATYNDGVYDLYTDDGYVRGTVRYNITVSGTKNLYFDCFDLDTNDLGQHINDSFAVRVNGYTIRYSFPQQEDNGFLYLGTFTDREITVELILLKDVYAASFGVFAEDQNAVTEAVAQANGATLTVKGHKINGTVTAESGDKLLLSLPYDNGYTFKVNGKKVKAEKVLTDFIAIPLESGENHIEASYRPQGFIAGLLLSLLGVASAVFFAVIKAKKLLYNEKAEAVAAMISFWAVVGLCAIVFIAVYIAPMIISAL